MQKFELKKGLIQVYTGGGKGKTSAALGLALRAVGYNLKVCVIQFLKGSPTGELRSAEKLEPYLKIEQWGRKPLPEHGRVWVRKGKVAKEDKDMAQNALERAHKILTGGEFDVVILDEINVALYFGLIQLDKVLGLIEMKPPEVELVLTGQKAPKEIIEVADLVTEMVKVKHPFDQGIPGREGIEY